MLTKNQETIWMKSYMAYDDFMSCRMYHAILYNTLWHERKHRYKNEFVHESKQLKENCSKNDFRFANEAWNFLVNIKW